MIVFLDRDGVILKPSEDSGKSYAIKQYSEFEYYEDARESLNQLVKYASYIFVITNQPDLNSGKLTYKNLRKIHNRLRKDLPISDIFFCPHTTSNNCICRKPKIGLFQAAENKWRFLDKDSWMVGDRDIDIQAGKAFGCRNIFIDRGWKDEAGVGADFKVRSLREAIEIIIKSTQSA